MAHNDEIKAAVVAFLSRFSPPRSIAGSAEAMSDEVIQITDAVARFAPRVGFQDWWPAVGTAIVQRMKTRAWPMVSEVETACRIATEAGRSGAASSDAVNEQAAIDRLESWFRKFGTQAPSQGRPSRTLALINRGVLRDLRHARFCGFDLTNDQTEQSRDQAPGPEEQKHHHRVMADLHAIGERMDAHRDEFARLRASVKPNESAA